MPDWISTYWDDMTMRQQIDPVPMPRLPRTRHQTKSCPFCARRSATRRSSAASAASSSTAVSQSGRKAQAGRRPRTSRVGDRRRQRTDKSESAVLWSGRPSLLALAGMFLNRLLPGPVLGGLPLPGDGDLVRTSPRPTCGRAVGADRGWLDAGGLALALLAMTLAWRSASLKSIHYEVTPDRIEWSRGIFDRHVDNIDMFRVVDLKLRQSLLECLLGIGTVVLITDESDPEFEFVKVNRCRDLYETLKEAGLNADKKRNVIHLE